MDQIHIWVTYGLIALSVVGYAVERWPIEAVAAASLSLFLVFFAAFPYVAADGSTLSTSELLAGFANPALITVMSLLIVGQGLFATDAMSRPACL